MPPGHGLGIKAGEIWAYRPTPSRPFERVRIVDPGDHYDAIITFVRLERDHETGSSRRSKLPCKWEYVEEYLEARKARDQAAELERAAAREATFAKTEQQQRRVAEHGAFVLAELRDLQAPLPLAYSVANAAEAVGYSTSVLYKEIKAGRLRPRWATKTKGIIPRAELERWVAELPDEKPA